MVDFSKLKNNRNNFLAKLADSVVKKTEYKEDERYWKPLLDKSKNGFAIIRFLPQIDTEDMPYVEMYSHAFQGPTGNWYIENSLTTIGQPDPVSEHNSALWNTGSEDNKKIVRVRKRKAEFISNIYVISHPARPEDEGKVFLYKYGKKIFGKIQEALVPSFAGDERLNPFDLWEGANFKIKIREVEGYPNYELSSFDSPKPLFDSDEKLEEVYSKVYSLKAEIDPSKFKSYDQLKARFEKVIGVSSTPVRSENKVMEEEQPRSAPEIRSRESEKVSPPWESSDSSDDNGEDSLDFFKKLAKKS